MSLTKVLIIPDKWENTPKGTGLDILHFFELIYKSSMRRVRIDKNAELNNLHKDEGKTEWPRAAGWE